MRKTLRPSGGHILDIDSVELDDKYLSLANNVNTRKGFPSRIGGRRSVYTSGSFADDIYHLLNLKLNTFNWWMLFGTTKVGARETTNVFDISPAGLLAVTNPSEWVATLLNGIPVFTNGRNSLFTWNGSGASIGTVVPGWPASNICHSVVAFRFHLFALNMEQPAGIFENMIMWSDAAPAGALPATWTPATSNEAGSAILADTPGRCIVGLPLAQQLLIYKPTSIYAVEYAGNPPASIFTVRPVARSVGALGPHTVVELGERHLVVGNDDVVITDGVNSQSIATDRIKTYLTNSIDDTNAANAFVMRDLAKREVWVCVPESGSQFATTAHVWDERRSTWVTRSLHNVRHAVSGIVSDTAVTQVWDADAAAWNTDASLWNDSGVVASRTQVVSSEGQNLLFVEDTTDLTSVSSSLVRQDITFGEDSQIVTTANVWIEGTGGGVSEAVFRLGSRLALDQAIVFGPFVPRGFYATGQTQGDPTPYEVTGRYITIEISVVSLSPWTIDRIAIEAIPNGSF